MRFLLRGFFLAVPLLILFSCSAPVDIEGDVFLVKGDGKPQPSAAKEVIFVEGLSLEDILIKVYLESVSDRAQESSLAYKELCNSSSKLQQSNILKLEEAVNKSTKEGIDKNIVDQEGSCSSLQEQLKSAKSLASENEERFNNLIASEQSKITKAKTEKARLNSILQKTITNKEKALYKEFMKNIIITAINDRRTSYSLKVTNNSPYNIKIDGHLKVQFYNYLDNPIGSHNRMSSYTRYGECSGVFSSYLEPDFAIHSDKINIERGVDNFGFEKSDFFVKGATATDSLNHVCIERFTPTERLELTKKYGADEKLWPDKNKIDYDKGHKITSGKFIPLEDELRNEKGGSIVYTSEEINFLTIARNLNWPESSKIKKQEEIIKNAKKQIRKINKESNEDPTIAKSFNSEKLVLACTSHLDIIEEKKKEIESRQSSLDTTTKCDISEPKKLSDSFVLEKEGEIGKLEELMNVNYSGIASLRALNVFADSPFRTSTNISGHYSLKEVPPGNYVIYSSYQDNFIEGIYLINKEIKEGDAIDLSNANFLEIGSLANLLDVFYEKCSEKVCGEDDLRNSLNIREAERRYEDRKGELEELQESLERLKNLFN